MKHLLIRRREFTKNTLPKIIKDYLYDYLKDEQTYVFDIHNTIEYGENGIDKDIFNFIKKNHTKLNIVLLSYDGNDKRVQTNNDKLDNYDNVFTKIPKIFIKKRKKHYILAYIANLLGEKYRSFHKISFFDDNYLNIQDAIKIQDRLLILHVYHYTAHTDRKSDESIDNISDVLSQNK